MSNDPTQSCPFGFEETPETPEELERQEELTKVFLERQSALSRNRQECLARWCAYVISKKYLHYFLWERLAEYDYGETDEEICAEYADSALNAIRPFLIDRMSKIMSGDLWQIEDASVRTGAIPHSELGLDKDWKLTMIDAPTMTELVGEK